MKVGCQLWEKWGLPGVKQIVSGEICKECLLLPGAALLGCLQMSGTQWWHGWRRQRGSSNNGNRHNGSKSGPPSIFLELQTHCYPSPRISSASVCYFKMLYKTLFEEGILLIQTKVWEPLIEFNLSVYQRQRMSPRKLIPIISPCRRREYKPAKAGFPIISTKTPDICMRQLDFPALSKAPMTSVP